MRRRMEPGERLKQARIAAGYKKAVDASRAHGWNDQTYLAHENCSRGIRAKVAQKYATALKVSLAWLQFGEGEPGFKTPARPEPPQRVEYDRALLERAIAASYQSLIDIDEEQAEEFAAIVLEAVEERQALPEGRRGSDLVKALALSAARLFSRPR